MAIEIKDVNKHESDDWEPSMLFTGYNVRAIIRFDEDAITNVNLRGRVERRLIRECGEGSDEFVMVTNTRTDREEVYLTSSARLISWKLQNMEQFESMFEAIEKHGDE